MDLYEKIIGAFPELENVGVMGFLEVIKLQDDADGTGAYIREWKYEKSIPNELKEYVRA